MGAQSYEATLNVGQTRRGEVGCDVARKVQRDHAAQSGGAKACVGVVLHLQVGRVSGSFIGRDHVQLVVSDSAQGSGVGDDL